MAWHSSRTLAGRPQPLGKATKAQSLDLPEDPKFCTEQGLRALWGKESRVLLRTKLEMTLGCGEELHWACLGYRLWGVGDAERESWAG